MRKKEIQEINLNAIFLQPTRWCYNNCKDCYVKEHDTGNESYIQIEEWDKIFKYFYIGPGQVNQITISLDSPPPISQLTNKKYLYHFRYMIEFFRQITSTLLGEFGVNSEKKYPQIHFTVRDIKTFQRYCFETHCNEFDILSKIDMLTLSNIDSIKDIEYYKNYRYHINYNYNLMTPINMSSQTITKELERIEEIAKKVDNIYFIMRKTSVGKPCTDLIQLQNQSYMKKDLIFLNTLKKYLSPYAKAKITEDGCLRDIINHRKTGFGCSSNVSRFQIWPDGSVTGCPYAYKSTGAGGQRLENILDNIKEERNKYDFEDICHLPKTYDSILK